MITLTEIQYRRLMLASRIVDRHLQRAFDRAAAADRRLTFDEQVARQMASLAETDLQAVPPRKR